MFHATIVPLDNFSSVLLQIVFYKEDGPPDDQNEGDGGARMVAHDHRDHPASFVLLRSFAKRTVLRMTKIKGTEEQELLQIILQRIRPAPFLCKCSFAKRTVLQMSKIKGTEEHGWLQMIIRMIRPPPYSSVPLQMVICKEDGPPDD